MDDFTAITGVLYWPEKGLLQIKREQLFKGRVIPPQGQKTNINGFSKKSKRRLAAVIAKSEVQFGSLMTLTFPDRCPISDGREAKKILNRFLTRLRRKYHGVEYVWILEFQRNNQPHFHVLTSVPGDKIDRRWFAQWWAQSILHNPPGQWSVHQGIAEDIYTVHKRKKAWEELRSSDGAQRYLLSYVGKEYQKRVPEGYTNVGRFWGCSQGVRHELPPEEEWPIDETTLREWLQASGLEWVSKWEYLPKYLHLPPVGARHGK